MTFLVKEFSDAQLPKLGPPKYTVVHSAPTYEDAEDWVHRNRELVHFELDADHEGCADYYTTAGTVGSIEPETSK